MLAGKPWFGARPVFPDLHPGDTYWHIYPETTPTGDPIDPRAANPVSKARLAMPGTHAMYYLGNTLTGVLWETVLRWVEPDANLRVEIRHTTLKGLRAVKIKRAAGLSSMPWLPLFQPTARAHGFTPDSSAWAEIQKHLNEPDHTKTHDVAKELFSELQSHGIPQMPVLAWASRQHQASRVYLAYDPPMSSGWWDTVGSSIALDDPVGHDLIRDELKKCGFTWLDDPLYDAATTPIGPMGKS